MVLFIVIRRYLLYWKLALIKRKKLHIIAIKGKLDISTAHNKQKLKF